MRRLAAAVALSASFLAAGPASADDGPPDPGKVRAASEQFDAGVGSFKKKDYEKAATHFELADAAVPSPKALRQAIRARAEAGQGSRAATLAALALERYPSDDATARLARETVEKFRPLLYKVSVTCAAPCGLSLGAWSVPGEAATRRVVYLDPGSLTLNASFAGEPGASKQVEATAGDSVEVRLEPKKKKAPPKASPPLDDDKPSKGETPPDDPKPDAPVEPERKGISPAFFGVSLAATVGVGAAMIWSGVDTQNNPGAAAVMAGCKGQGTACPLYQQGLAKQTRTNGLIGGTAAGAALTVVLAIFTGWRGSPKPAPTGHAGGEPQTPGPSAWLTVTAPPALSGSTGSGMFLDHGAVLGAAGVF